MVQAWFGSTAHAPPLITFEDFTGRAESIVVCLSYSDLGCNNQVLSFALWFQNERLTSLRKIKSTTQLHHRVSKKLATSPFPVIK